MLSETIDRDFSEETTNPKAIGILGATVAQFAARNFANQALSVITKPAAEKAWDSIFKIGQVETPYKDYLTEDIRKIGEITALLTGKIESAQLDGQLKEALNDLDKSLENFKASRTDVSVNSQMLHLRDSLKYCTNAIAILNDDGNPTWIGAYFTAISQYAFLAKQILFIQQNEDFAETILAPETLISRLEEAILYVTNQDMIEKITNAVDAQFGPVESKGKDTNPYPWGFNYYHNNTRNFLRNKSQESITAVREDLKKTALNLVYTQIVQPDVVRSWELIIEELKTNKAVYSK